ncbi:2-acylglycerol O-acyltransferase 1 [Eufriesea mexicana]|uniref:2-acylglycerol O-acyltransferase 1-like n=1 Tax=Eufriesea mexicana TaxID=516756 RepID=UPI00083BD3C3|nr:PREDICTED: 2-acylglycerol O-acyltransferase 1-like [Eufriesea mexicana]XP_017758627.1 PREDICTED: 2-acylglycerol O-acyltransferase 1-like [Eufriesea mexicana]XP_017758628.1 PREDICTED: 2-acylglycerol O-acyltransferase 1-like [Eufriesea mexicana]OAD56202.1 2-acylglycerol O-acyltransferase 1 [Eufriesea mexicana]
MEILGVKFAPLNVPLKRRLETLSVAVWFVLLVFGDLFGYLGIAYLLFYTETIRYFALLYLVWMYYDWNTCNEGGRSVRLTRWMRNTAWFHYFCNYFPLKLVKTTDLDPNRLYLFCSFPHGILSMGVFGAFSTDVLGCKKLFPGLDFRVVVLDQHFRIPLFREYAYLFSGVSSSAESINHQLSTKPPPPFTGRATVLIVGGASESLECKPGTYRILVKRRKGFVKIALKHGAPLVPVFSFGETDVYDQLYRSEGSLLKRTQHYIRKKIGIAPVILRGRGFFQYSFGIIAQRRPITVVVGSPMDLPKIEEPTAEQIDHYHEKFIEHLLALFENEKHKYVENADSVTIELVQ